MRTVIRPIFCFDTLYPTSLQLLNWMTSSEMIIFDDLCLLFQEYFHKQYLQHSYSHMDLRKKCCMVSSAHFSIKVINNIVCTEICAMRCSIIYLDVFPVVPAYLSNHLKKYLNNTYTKARFMFQTFL